MRQTTTRIVATVTMLSMMQAGCYNTYTIDQKELEKLESSVEPQEVVTVLADCEKPSAPKAPKARYKILEDSGALAQNEAGEAKASDAAPAAAKGAMVDPKVAQLKAEAQARGCVAVPVSTANAIRVKTTADEELRVTPFNFIMDERQLVSPEYDLLLSRNDVTGAEVDEFNFWLTVGTIAGVTALAVGAFVAITLLAPDETGFSQ